MNLGVEKMETKGTKLLEGSIWKGIVSFAIPMFLVIYFNNCIIQSIL